MIPATSQNRQEFIAKVPKAELHLHIEGTLEPELMLDLAQRNGIRMPFASIDEVRAAYDFSNLQDFLDIYYRGMAVLQTEQDFFDLTMAYLRRAAADNVRHVEIFFDPQGHSARGVSFDTAIGGITRALAEGGAQFGVTYRLIMCFLRHLDEESAFDTLRQAATWLHQIDGVGLDSSEVGHPPSKFARVFSAAREKGLKLVAHAGEEGPPEYIWEALDLLKIDRIDHGNRALEDERLIERIIADGQTLTLCPLSNLKLCVISNIAESPVKHLLDLGVNATVNSDDPAYFGGYVNANFNAIAEGLDLSIDELATLAANSFRGSFLEDVDKDRHVASINALAAEYRE